MSRRLVATCFALAALLASARPVTAQSAAPAKSPVAVVNLNTATADQLEALPGIGARTAARIIEFRQKNGPFKRIEDLMNVRGIGEKNFLQIKPLVSVGPARTDKPAAGPGN